MGWCGGATETSIGGRMCDCILGLHVTGGAVYREMRVMDSTLALLQVYLAHSSTEVLLHTRLSGDALLMNT